MKKPFKFLEVSSPQNVRYKSWLKALDGRNAKKTSEAILSGSKFTQEVLAQHRENIIAILAQTEAEIAALIGSAESSFAEGVACYVLSRELFGALDIYGTNSPLLLIKAPSLPEWNGELQKGLTVFLPFQNPINLGTIIRSSAALGAQVVVLKEAASVYHSKTLRAAGPNIFKCSIFSGPSLATLAEICSEKRDMPLYALSLKGENLFKFTFPGTMGLVAGPEGPGLEGIWPDFKRLTIPMQDSVESLNAAAAVDMAIAAFNCGLLF